MFTIMEKLREVYGMTTPEAEKAINFVVEALEEDIAYTEHNEPYATESIREMKIAVKQVRDLEDHL